MSDITIGEAGTPSLLATDPPAAAPSPTPSSPPNEYDTLLAQAPPQPAAPATNPYDSVVIDMAKERNQRVRGALLGAQQSTPDQAAKAANLAQKTGVPSDVVERNLTKVDGDHKLNEYDKILERSPKLSSWLLTDQINAKVASAEGDFSKLGLIEEGVNELTRGIINQQAGGALAGWKVATRKTEQLDAALAKQARGEYLSPFDKAMIEQEGEIRQSMKDAILQYGGQFYAKQAESAAMPMRPVVLEMQKAGKQGDWAGVFSALKKDPLGAIYSISLQSAAMLPFQLVGNAAGGPAGAFGVSFLSEYMGAVQDALEEAGVNLQDPTQVTQAFANKDLMAKVERQATIKAGTIAAFDTATLRLAKVPLGIGRRAVVREATNIPAQIALQGAAGAAGEAAGSTLAGMKVDPASVVFEALGEMGSAPVEVATTRWGSLVREDATAKEQERYNSLPPLEQYATGTAIAIDRLVAIANDTNLAKTSPSKLQEFIASVSGADATVFLPAEALRTFMQDMTGLQAEQFAERLGIADQLKRIAATNEDVAIPLARYITGASEAHAAWRDQIRTEVDGFSIREAQEFEKAKAAQVDELQKRFEEQIQAGIVADPATVVYQQVMAMLKANGYTNEVAAQHAALYAARYTARAARNPERYADALDAFQQAGPGTGMTVQTVLPDGTRALGPDVFDTILDSIRSGKDPIVPPAHFAHLEARKEAQRAALEPILGPEGAPPPPTPKQVSEARQKAAMEEFKARRQEVADALASMGLDPATMTNAQIREAVTKKAEGTTFQQEEKQPLSDSLIMVAQRGDRVTGNRLLLSPAEKAAIEASVGPSGLSVAQITATVRKHKLAHPPAQGWEPLVFLKARLDKKGKPEFLYEQVPYGFIRDNNNKEISPADKRYAARVEAIGSGIAEEVRVVYRRALAGDKNAQNILAQAGWYKAMRTRLRQEFGGLGDLFADALGATSPNTPVRGNWENAVDGLRRASRGDFDTLMPKWVAWSENIDRLEMELRAFVNEQIALKEAGSDKPRTKKSVLAMPEYQRLKKELSAARELPADLMPTKESGAQYGFNGKNLVRAMLDLWRVIKNADTDIGRGGTAPKALNFSGNLIGFREKATIDVWAARLLQRLAGKRRIPSMAEATVSGEMLSDASTTKQFGFGQDAFSHAVNLIRADSEMKQNPALAAINDDDLQAVVWFIEKEVWTVNNWTSVAGEGGSFELEANLTGTAKQARVRELRKIIDSSPASADVEIVVGADAVAEKVAKWEADHKAEIDELGEINQRLSAEAETLSKKDRSDLKKRAAELEKATKLPKPIAAEMRAVESAQRRIDQRAASKVLARAELATLERPVDRYVGGLSTQMSVDNQGLDYVPTDADMARLGEAIRLAIYEKDANADVLASKALATEGRYGSVERSLDLEIVTREGYDPSTVWAEMLRQAQAARQDSTFLSRVLRENEPIDYTRHRPGVEIYFRDAAAAQQLEGMLESLAKEGVSFLTVSVDGRRMPGYVAGAMPAAVGVRLQYVPEFEQRYGNEDLSGLDDQAIADKMQAKYAELQTVAARVAANVAGVSFSGVFWHETKVAFSHQYQEKIDAIATRTAEAEPGSAGTRVWEGQSVRAGLADADRQSREAAGGKPDEQSSGDVSRRDAVGADAEVGKTYQQSASDLRQRYGYSQDNPAARGNTEWLQEKQAAAERDYAKNNGIQGATTGWLGNVVELPLSMVAGLPGARNEKRAPGDGQYDALWASVEKYGWQQKDSPILIEINHRGEAFITEGNTRARVAADLGKETIWAEVKWLNGGEMVQGDWSPDALLQKISTYQQEARGEISFSDNVSTISLFQARDLSTLAHETGHLWLAELEFDAKSRGASDQIKADWQTVLTFLGSDGYITREQHELFARAFETYLMEGKAPTEGLRGVFRSFKNWLVSIYRNLARLQAPISPEMREVFDRLIATDEEIAAARDQVGFNPVFTDAKSAGMTEAEFAAYTRRVTQVVDAAEQAVLEKVMASIRRQKTKEVAAEKKKIRAEVTAEMMKDPGNAALHLLRMGSLYGDAETPEALKGAKLSRAALVVLIGEDGLKNLPHGVYANEGIDPDDLAQVFGLGNGTELVERLMQIQAEQNAMRAKGDNRSVLNARIAEETQKRLTESLGDPLNDGSIEAEAMAAVHSDKQGALLSSELKVLARKAGHSGAITLADIETWAAKTIGEMSVYQATQAAKYQRAERMAGQAVQRALIKGDFMAAFKAKQDQLVNFALYREAKKAAQEAEAVRKLADRYASADTIKSMDQGALDQIHQILEDYDFKRRSGTLLAERTTFSAWAAEQAAQGFEVIEPPRLKGAGLKHFSQMTMEEIRGLGDTIKQIAHIGRWKQEMVDGARKRAFEEIVAEAVETAGKIDQRGISQMRRGTTGLQDKLGDIGTMIRSTDAALLKMETLFEWLDDDKTGRGVFSRVVFRRIAEAQAKERDMQADLAGKMAALYDKVPAEQRKAWSTQHVIPELGVKLNKSQIIAVALNTGNASNLDKMLRGEKWDEGTVRQVLNKFLTKEEWQFVQDTWDLIDSLWPQTEALEKRINGVAPPKVEATPVETPYGTLRGGYYPMAYDKAGDIKADRIASKSAEGLFDPEYRRASVRAGSTNKRVEGFNAKVLLSLNVIGQHLNEVAHDLAFREAVMDTYKFLSDDRVREAIRSAVGPEYEKQTQVWLKAVANEWAIDRRGLEGVDKWLQAARANTAIVGMGFRVSTMLSQVAGFANSIQRLGTVDMAAGLRDFYKDPAGMAAFVREKSGEMRHRANDLERDIRLALKRMEGQDGNLDAVRRFAFRGISLFDAAVSLPTWMGAYNKGLKQGMTDADAVYYADKMVRDTQGAGSVKDLSAIQRGGEALKLFTMFYSYFNVFYNRQRGIVRDARAADSFSDYMDVVAQSMWLMVIPTLLAAMLSGQGPEDDEEWWAWAMRNVGFGVFSGLPVVRDAANTASNLAGGKGFGGAKMTPVQGVIDSALHLGKDGIKLVNGEETSKTAIKNLFNVGGFFTGLPTGQLGATTQFLWDALAEGTQDPEGLIDWLNGLVFGPKKQK